MVNFRRCGGPTPQPAPPRVNWEDYNYPPCGIHMWHYSPGELEPAPRAVARMMQAAYCVPVCSLLVNLLVTVVLLGMGLSDPINLMYSAFNVIIGVLAGLWTWMTGYQGLGQKKHDQMRRYLWCWAILTVVMLLLCTAALNNINGWVRVGMLQREGADIAAARNATAAGDGATDAESGLDGGRQFWLAASVVESILWTISVLLGVNAWCWMWQVYHHGPLAAAGLGKLFGGSPLAATERTAEAPPARGRPMFGRGGRARMIDDMQV